MSVFGLRSGSLTTPAAGPWLERADPGSAPGLGSGLCNNAAVLQSTATAATAVSSAGDSASGPAAPCRPTVARLGRERQAKLPQFIGPLSPLRREFALLIDGSLRQLGVAPTLGVQIRGQGQAIVLQFDDPLLQRVVPMLAVGLPLAPFGADLGLRLAQSMALGVEPKLLVLEFLMLRIEFIEQQAQKLLEPVVAQPQCRERLANLVAVEPQIGRSRLCNHERGLGVDRTKGISVIATRTDTNRKSLGNGNRTLAAAFTRSIVGAFPVRFRQPSPGRFCGGRRTLPALPKTPRSGQPRR